MIFDKPHEECGVFAVFGKSRINVSALAYYGLFALQHRGQESCGIALCDGGSFRSHKNIGTVNDVFTKRELSALGSGNIAVAHVRYATTGVPDRSNAQPIEVNHINGKLAVVHNGNLVNSALLRRRLEMEGSIFHTTSDTEIIAYLITKEKIRLGDDLAAVKSTMNIIEGAFSLAVMLKDKLIAVRDKNGLRPLCYGVLPGGAYVVASESCALDAVGAQFIRDIKPGEIIVFDENSLRCDTSFCNAAPKSTCVFEYIYFARPDSVIDGVAVHSARLRAGEFLAKEYPVQADIVIGVPDSGIDAAIGYSQQSGIPYGIGFIKNKYIGRTFIAPGQSSREDKVKIKLNPLAHAVRGKRVVIIDDSIVRGTTSARIVGLLREAGATEIHMRVTAPPFVNPCFYGTDIDSRENLLACNYTLEEITKMIGADSLGYLSIESARRIAGEGGGYCCACFDGEYPTPVPGEQSKNKFE